MVTNVRVNGIKWKGESQFGQSLIVEIDLNKISVEIPYIKDLDNEIYHLVKEEIERNYQEIEEFKSVKKEELKKELILLSDPNGEILAFVSENDFIQYMDYYRKKYCQDKTLFKEVEEFWKNNPFDNSFIKAFIFYRDFYNEKNGKEFFKVNYLQNKIDFLSKNVPFQFFTGSLENRVIELKDIIEDFNDSFDDKKLEPYAYINKEPKEPYLFQIDVRAKILPFVLKWKRITQSFRNIDTNKEKFDLNELLNDQGRENYYTKTILASVSFHKNIIELLLSLKSNFETNYNLKIFNVASDESAFYLNSVDFDPKDVFDLTDLCKEVLANGHMNYIELVEDIDIFIKAMLQARSDDIQTLLISAKK